MQEVHPTPCRNKWYMHAKVPVAVAKQGKTFEVESVDWSGFRIQRDDCRGRIVPEDQNAYARKAKRPAAAAPTRPSLTEREPAALSLSCSSPEPESPPLPVDLAPEEEVVMEPEPEAAGPEAGTVPLFWGKGAATEAVVVGAGAVAISASEARAEEATDEDSEMALSTAVWMASETDVVAASAPAAALSVAAVTAAEETTEETAEATSGFSATADVTAAEASAAAGASRLLVIGDMKTNQV